MRADFPSSLSFSPFLPSYLKGRGREKKVPRSVPPLFLFPPPPFSFSFFRPVHCTDELREEGQAEFGDRRGAGSGFPGIPFFPFFPSLLFFFPECSTPARQEGEVRIVEFVTRRALFSSLSFLPPPSPLSPFFPAAERPSTSARPPY